MKNPNKLILGLFFSFNLVFCSQAGSETRIQNNEVLFSQMKKLRNLSSEQITSIREIFSQSNRIGQGNPAVTRHPISPEAAAASLGNNIETAQNSYRRRNFERICGRPFMAPIYDPLSQKPNEATVCMDMFEYPNIPMVYPVVWVNAKEAALLCAAEGKRLSDAHEWEGAAAGNLLEPDYPFELIKGLDINSAVKIMRSWHNQKYASTANNYSIGEWKPGICATASFKNSTCNGGNYSGCGSNTYPSGSFPKCKSPLGIYDLDGNAAEHMNLPLTEQQMSSLGSTSLGVTEMKGSWFIWDRTRAHEHWARWRAPFWHGTKVMSDKSHSNYHLGFRCVRDLK